MRRIICLVLSFLFLILSFTGCSKNKATESISDTYSEVITSETETTTEATTVIDTTSEVIETTEELVMEEVYESEDFPEVQVTVEGNSYYTISISVEEQDIVVEEDLNQDWSTFNVTRVDNKVISVYLFGTTTTETETGLDWDKSLKTVVLSTSGERINLTDLICDQTRFNEYLSRMGIEDAYNSLIDCEWCFDINGLSIFDQSYEVIKIPYVDFEGILNTNYCPDDGPMYGCFTQLDPGISINGHQLSFYGESASWLYVDGEEVIFENNDGDTVETQFSTFFFVSNTNRYYIWAYETEVDPAENGNPEYHKCAMLVEITNGYPEVIVTTTDGPNYYDSIYDIPEDILELMNFSEW